MATPTEYVAGLIDAQLKVTPTKSPETLRVTLTSTDPRVAEHLDHFVPTRTTIVKRPGKKDACTILYVGSEAKPLLRFAAEHCVLKKELAIKTLDYLEGTVQDIEAPLPESVDDVDIDWASGFFDARGEVIQPAAAKKRGIVRIALPKAERFIIPALQKVLHGKCQKEKPTRLVYDTKDSLANFLEAVEGHVHVKCPDLQTVM